MDQRKALPRGTVLQFPGITCELGAEIGRGSNALVYEGSYRDTLEQNHIHRILIKELFPLEPQDRIFRREDGSICIDPEGEETFRIHRQSFEAGNKVHLMLLESCPDQIGANLNTYPLNGTLYTLLGVSGGQSLGKLLPASPGSLRQCASRILTVLDALEVFHQNGLAHLDIAPDNILLLGAGSRERALLIDYNSTMAVGLPHQAGTMIFSIKQGYTAPEIRSGRSREIGFASDLYSVTAVFFRVLSGKPLTTFQMIRSGPPDISGCPCVSCEPETVRSWVQEILRRGLQSIPARRYQSVAQMRRDLEELIDRIEGVGITHWALWEAGQRNADRMVRENPSLSFLRDSANLFPSMVSDGKDTFAAEPYFRGTTEHCLFLAGGGMGKTTALLRLCLSGKKQYAPDAPAVIYLSLYGWQPGENHYILNRLLDGLRFHADTRTFEDARKVLLDLLGHTLKAPGKGGKTQPVLLLLLDGLNEARGDTCPLLDEIRSLSALQGVRLVVAGRAEEAALPFPVLRLAELTEESVQQAVSNAGLLLPESTDLQALLRTPLMLSMYLESGRITGQTIISSPEELLQAYLSALKEKAIQDLPESTDRRWQIDAAMELVLPALAAEIDRRHSALDDQKLFPVVEKCYTLLTARLSRRFFPQWIGHTAAIRGSAHSAEEWYGQIVHDLLWKQFGLLIRDDLGRYMIMHQMIAEHLMIRGGKSRKKVRRYYLARSLLTAFCACLAITSVFVVYQVLIRPGPGDKPEQQTQQVVLAPYDEDLADSIMNEIAGAYYRAVNQNNSLRTLAVCARDDPDSFQDQLFRYHHSIPYQNASTNSPRAMLTLMLNSGEAMPWSGIPMEEEECSKLLTLTSSRQEDYDLYGAVLEYVMTDDYAFRHYGSEFPDSLATLLETDAKITAILYRIACEPHLTGKYADQTSSEQAKYFWNLVAEVPSGLETLPDTQSISDARKVLLDLEKDRREQLSVLQSCGALYAYNNAVVDLPAVSSTATFSAETVDRLLDDLIGSLYTEEKLYGDMLSVLDAIDRFDQDNSWENLQRARAMLFLAKRDVMSLKAPETTLTEEDQMAFLEAGHNVIFMENMGLSFSGIQTNTLNTFSSLRTYLLLNIFIRDDWEIAMQNAKVNREIAECCLQYNANLATRILMIVDEPQATEMFTQLMAEYCPLTDARRATSPVSMDENTAASEALLNQVDSLVSELYPVVGAKADRNNRLSDQIDASQWEEIGRNLLKISGTPDVFLPFPSGIQNAEEHYFWMEKGEYILTPLPSEMPDRRPDACMIQIPGVSLETAKEYQQTLADYGEYPEIDYGEEDKLNLIYTDSNSIFTLGWEDSIMTITMLQEPFFMIPTWFANVLISTSD